MNNPNQLNRILQKIASQAVPNGSIDLRARIHRQMRQRQQGASQRKLLGSLVATSVILITFLGFGGILQQTIHGNISYGQATPQQAERISYHGTIVGHFFTRSAELHEKVSTWYAQVWAETPNKVRIEDYYTCSQYGDIQAQPLSETTDRGGRAVFHGPTGARCLRPSTITLRNELGTLYVMPIAADTMPINIIYSDRSEPDMVHPNSAVSYLMPDQENAFIPNPQTDQVRVQALFGAGVNIKRIDWIGAEPIAGRDAYVLDIQYENQDKHDEEDVRNHLYRRLVWLDKVLHIPLAEEHFNESGQSFRSWVFTDFELNPQLDAGIFDYVANGDYPIRYQNLHDTWQQLATSLNFEVYNVTREGDASNIYTTGLIARRPYYDAERDVVVQEFLSREDEKNPIVALRITQSTKAITPDKLSSNTLFLQKGKTNILLEIREPLTQDDLQTIADDLDVVTILVVKPTSTPQANMLNGKVLVPKGKVLVTIPKVRLLGEVDLLKPGSKFNLKATFMFVDTDPGFQQVVTPRALKTLHLKPATYETNAPTNAPTMTPTLVDWSIELLGTADTPRILTQETLKNVEVVYIGTLTPQNLSRVQVTPLPGKEPVADGAMIITVAVSADDANVLTWLIEAQVPMSIVIVE